MTNLETTLMMEIFEELARARAKFPGDNVTSLAAMEEAGELAKAVFDEPRDAVRKEAIQTAVMAMRVVLDGDATLRVWRVIHGLDPLIEGETLSGAELIAIERHRQIAKEGWTPEHDDTHDDGELGLAAACYALSGASNEDMGLRTVDYFWPWDRRWWKPMNRKSDLIRAGALIAAEIDRLNRLEAKRDAEGEAQ